MAGHNAWLKSGFEKGAFLLAGTIEPKQGGAILVGDMPRGDLEALIAADPFVANKVVSVEITEVTPAKADARLAFLVNN